MGKKELDRVLDTLIIDGIRKEAEQDNADFENAMLHISDENFHKVVKRVPRVKVRKFRPWIYSRTAAAAIICAVIIPSYNAMNDRLCESALIAYGDYITPAKGAFDISTATAEQIEARLPEMEAEYRKAISDEDLRDTGWNLSIAYLKLHDKSKAIDILKTLSERFKGTPFGIECANMLKLLD